MTIVYSLDSRLRGNDRGGSGNDRKRAVTTDGGRKERKEKVELGDTPRPPAESILHLFVRKITVWDTWGQIPYTTNSPLIALPF
jgi:hypothetical protein